MKAARRPYRPSYLVVGSGLLHLAAVAAVLRWPATWPAWSTAILANHGLLTAAGLWPRSRLLGPNLRRLPLAAEGQPRAVALTFDDGPEPAVTPRVLEMLDRAGVAATFFLVGERAAQQPGLVREIAAAGHAVANHTWSHRKAFALLPPGAMAAELDRAQDVLATLTGTAPAYFRPPAGIRSVLLEPLLARRGLFLASWTRRGLDAFARDAGAVHRRLVRGLAPGDILLLHDGQLTSTQRRQSAAGEPLVIAALSQLLQTLSTMRLTSVSLTPDHVAAGHPA